ncbi:MAG: hypothetical protein AB1306_03805 [Nitrospirota bacterium]
MLKKLSIFIAGAFLLFAIGCSSTLEGVNKGAEDVGEVGGKVLRVPGSASKGVAGGLAGEPESNPYGR